MEQPYRETWSFVRQISYSIADGATDAAAPEASNALAPPMCESRALGPPLGGMDHGQNPQAVIEHASDNDVGHAGNDKFAAIDVFQRQPWYGFHVEPIPEMPWIGKSCV
jgi:hypothetical protein